MFIAYLLDIYYLRQLSTIRLYKVSYIISVPQTLIQKKCIGCYSQSLGLLISKLLKWVICLSPHNTMVELNYIHCFASSGHHRGTTKSFWVTLCLYTTCLYEEYNNHILQNNNNVVGGLYANCNHFTYNT